MFTLWKIYQWNTNDECKDKFTGSAKIVEMYFANSERKQGTKQFAYNVVK